MSKHHHTSEEHASEQASKWEKMHAEAEEHQPEQAAEQDNTPLSHEAWQKRYDVLVEEAEKLKNQMLGAQAELQNVRRRSERDVEQAHLYGTKKMLQDLLPVLDSLVRATEGLDMEDPQVINFAQGVELTIEMFIAMLTKHGVVMINPAIGSPFNPETQEAMSMVKDPNAAPNTVLQVLQRGYMLNDRVVRAAMVVVSQ